MSEFKNKVAFVTGGNSGIGKATAIAFAKEGAKVVIAARREKEGLAVVEQIKQFGGEAIFAELDVSKPGSVKLAIEKTIKNFGRLDYCFNNAGVNIDSGVPFHEFNDDSWAEMVNINLSGVFYCMKYEIQQMLKNGGGFIVNMSSVAGIISKPFVSAGYNATKHGVIGLTKNAALIYAQKGIRVNAVCPAIIMTPLVEALPDSTKAALSSLHPIGRYGTVEEVADTVLWLCSEKTGFVIGQAIVIDGGLTIG
jgi:NAD(P)-dependent dehydrogenase (short-subunit alcohol dehydrogenase family)